MQNVDLGRVTQCLVNDAISLSQMQQRSELLLGGVSVQIEMQSNLLESDGHVFRNSECATKIEIAFGSNRCVT